MKKIVYQGENIRSYFTPADQRTSDRLVICFHGRLANPGFGPLNFGERFLASHGFDAIHVQTKVNNWYQSPSTYDVLEAIKHWGKPYKHRVTYGSSMGGYAALAFSGLVNADVVVAFVPQSSPRAPFDTRWINETKLINPVLDDLELQLSRTAKIYVALDPHQKEDRLHADAIESFAPICRLDFPLVEHDVMRFLAEIGAIEHVILNCLNGKAMKTSFRSIVRERRRISSAYMFYAGHYARKRRGMDMCWRYWLKAMDMPLGQVQYYKRLLRAVPPKWASEEIDRIAQRRPENTSLHEALQAMIPAS